MENLNKDNLTGINHDGAFANTPLRYLTASSIMKDKVINAQGDKLGDIRDIMLNIRDGNIEYAVIEFGGFLGLGEKLFAIPFRMLKIDTDEHAFVLNVDKETLKNAPGFDKNHWPGTNDHSFKNTATYWGDFMGPNTGAIPY